jgi:hypothetical protein
LAHAAFAELAHEPKALLEKLSGLQALGIARRLGI